MARLVGMALNVAAVAVLNAVKEKRPIIPVLSTIHVGNESGRLLATATDLNTWVQVPVENMKPGLYEIIGKEFVPSKMDVKNFPSIKEAVDEKRKLWAVATLNELDRATDCVSVEESRYTLNGIAFVQSEGKVTQLVATDGHRLSYNRLRVNGNAGPKAQLVTRSAAVIAHKFCKKDGTVRFDFGELYHSFKVGGATFYTRVLTGNFPNFEAIMPREVKEQWTVDRKALLDGLKILKPYLKESRSGCLNIVREKSLLAITAKTDEHSRTIELPVKLDLRERTKMPMQNLTVVMPMRVNKDILGLNHAYLLETASGISGDRVVIGIRDFQTAVAFSGIPFTGEFAAIKKAA